MSANVFGAASKMLKCLAILPIFLIGRVSSDPETFLKILKVLPFQVHKPALLEYEGRQIYALKTMFQQKISLQLKTFSKTNPDLESSTICLLNSKAETDKWVRLISSQPLLGTLRPIVIFFQGSNLEEYILELTKQFPIQINQMVYFINLQSKRLFETYSVNTVFMHRTLGEFDSNLKSFIPSTTSLDFVKRRGNFNGLHINAMAQIYIGSIFAPDGYQDFAKFHSKNQTFEVTDLVSGPQIEMFKQMSMSLNFSFSLYQRKDRAWGSVQNGQPNGMLKNLHEGSADIVVAVYTISRIRADFVDFLPPFLGFKIALLIGNHQVEEVTWTMFVKPFQWDIWIALILTALVFAMWLHWSVKNDWSSKVSLKDCLDFLGWFWATFMANVGRKPTMTLSEQWAASKMVVFVCLLGGTIIWIGYRASMTTELSVSKIVHPFDSLEGLSRTDYK